MKNIFKKFKKNNEPYKVILKENELDICNDITVTKDDEEKATLLQDEEIERELYNIFIRYLNRPNILSFEIMDSPKILDNNIEYDPYDIIKFIHDKIDTNVVVSPKLVTTPVPYNEYKYKVYIYLIFNNIDTVIWYNYFRYSTVLSNIGKVKLSVLYNTYNSNINQMLQYKDFIVSNDDYLNELTSYIIDSIASSDSKNLVFLKFDSTTSIPYDSVSNNVEFINKFYEKFNIKIVVDHSILFIDISKLRQKQKEIN